MLFLIEYDRSRLVTFQSFENAERAQVDQARIDLEISLNRRGVQHEIVILEAANEAALRRTHRRYFEDLKSLAAVSL